MSHSSVPNAKIWVFFFIPPFFNGRDWQHSRIRISFHHLDFCSSSHFLLGILPRTILPLIISMKLQNSSERSVNIPYWSSYEQDKVFRWSTGAYNAEYRLSVMEPIVTGTIHTLILWCYLFAILDLHVHSIYFFDSFQYIFVQHDTFQCLSIDYRRQSFRLVSIALLRTLS